MCEMVNDVCVYRPAKRNDIYTERARWALSESGNGGAGGVGLTSGWIVCF